MTTHENDIFCEDNIIPKYIDKFEKNVNDSDSTEEERPSIRWAPLGATASPEPDYDELKSFQSNQQCSKQETIIKQLEEEQEQLNSSLVLLTSHFAQIQLRLKQIVDDKSSNIEEKLKELEEFAFRGVPDILCIKNNSKQNIKNDNEKQMKIIEDLKQKLEDLESYAYQVGEIKEPPTSKVLASQKFIIEQLRSQLDIKLENFVTLSDTDLKNAVDNAINEIINPLKVREKLVLQLKTQILDLERFIEYLQDDDMSQGRKGTTTVKNSNDFENQSKTRTYDAHRSKKNRENATRLIQKALNLLQLIAASQFGCHIHEKPSSVASSTRSKSDAKNNAMHWGDIRAQLEVVIEKIIELSDRMNFQKKDSSYSSSEDLTFFDIEYDSDNEKFDNCELKKQLLCFVRKDFSTKLMQLMQHGMCKRSHSNSLIAISCLSSRNLPKSKSQHNASHPWDIILYFYETKKGKEIINSPVCKLSDSFDLDNIGGQLITNKQQLLRAIGIVVDSHLVYKRNKDSQFKAFVCLALNEKKLADWLRIILKNRVITNSFYEPWSYTLKMGFDDTLHSLRRLSKIDFDLPFDISIRQLSKIKDAF